MPAERAAGARAARPQVGRVRRAMALMLCWLVSGCWVVGLSGPLRGRVLDGLGAPLAGVVVAGMRGSAMSGEDGAFVLGESGGPYHLSKPYYTASATVPRADGVFTMTRTSAPLSVVWDERWQNPAMSAVQRSLATSSMVITRVTAGELPPAEVYVLASPAWFTEAAAATYRAAIEGGAKLVVLGEWGGYDGLDLDACNALSAAAGVRFSAATLQTYATGEPQSWVTIAPTGSVCAGLKQGIRLFTAGALDVASPGVTLLSSAETSARIQAWSRGPSAVVAAGPMGRGKVLAIADSSLWSDEVSSLGEARWQSLDNAAFARAALSW